MNIENLKSNTCSLEEENEILKLVGDMELQVLKMLIVRTVLFISKNNIKIGKTNNLKRIFSIERD
jgi:hypothetical protein